MPEEKEFLRSIYQQRAACVKYLKDKTGCSPEEAENSFIEAVLVLRKKYLAGETEQISELKSYLARTTYTVWRREYFKEKKKLENAGEVERYFYDYLDNRSIGQEDITNLKEGMFNVAVEALGTLNEKCRNIIRYFYYDGKSMSEIARLMNFNTQAVATATKYRCFKELKQLAIDLKKRYETEGI